MSKIFKFSVSTLILVTFSSVVVAIVLGTYGVQQYRLGIKRQTDEITFNKYISLGRGNLREINYKDANLNFMLALSYANTASEAQQATQFLGQTDFKYAQSTGLIPSKKLLSVLMYSMKLENDSHDTNGRGLIEYSIGLVDERIGLNESKGGSEKLATMNLTESQNYMKRAELDGHRIASSLNRVAYELGTLQEEGLISKSKQLWKDGAYSQAIKNLKRAVRIKTNAQLAQVAKSLIISYNYKLTSLIQEQALQQQQQEFANERSDMKRFDGIGNVDIAVADVVLEQSTDLHTAGSGMTFIKLWVGVINNGAGSEDVNPLYFTLSTLGGQTASIDDDTFDLSNYLDATTIDTGQQVGGWLIFYIPQETQYTLNYQDMSGNTDQKLIIT